MEVLINKNLTDDELDKLKKGFEASNDIPRIIYGEGVNFDTIKVVNEILTSINNGKSMSLKPKQELKRVLTEEETKKASALGVNTKDFSALGSLNGNMTSLEELIKYQEYKDNLTKLVGELEMNSMAEVTALVYSRIGQDFVFDNDNTKTIYQSVLSGSASNKNLNVLMIDILKSLGIECNLQNDGGYYKINVIFDDTKHAINGVYPCDVATDCNINSALGDLVKDCDAGFAQGLDKETKEKVFNAVRNKLKNLTYRMQEEQNEVKDLKKESDFILTTDEAKKYEKSSDEIMGDIPVIKKYGTYTIPVELIKKENSSNKVLQFPSNILDGKTFLINNNITDEKSFGDFLVKNGANPELANLVINENITGYYATLKSKAESGANFSLKQQYGETILYIPTTENDNHSLTAIVVKYGNIRMISSEHNEYMENGIRYGSTSVTDFEMNEPGSVKMSQATNKVSLVENAPPAVLLPIYDIFAKKEVAIISGSSMQSLGTPSEERVLCRFENGEIVAANIEETNKVENLHNLGFDEKYYTKAKIAGRNNSDGNVYYLEEEPMSLDEAGIEVANGFSLTKRAGKANIFIMSSILGFIFGLGIFIALLILKNT